MLHFTAKQLRLKCCGMTAGAVKPASSAIHNMKEAQTPPILPQNTRPEATQTAGELRRTKRKGGLGNCRKWKMRQRGGARKRNKEIFLQMYTESQKRVGEKGLKRKRQWGNQGERQGWTKLQGAVQNFNVKRNHLFHFKEESNSCLIIICPKANSCLIILIIDYSNP